MRGNGTKVGLTTSWRDVDVHILNAARASSLLRMQVGKFIKVNISFSTYRCISFVRYPNKFVNAWYEKMTTAVQATDELHLRIRCE